MYLATPVPRDDLLPQVCVKISDHIGGWLREAYFAQLLGRQPRALRVYDRFVEIVSGVLVADEVVTRGAYSLAFAGKGSVSLKEALDAAHGHEHNEDGSEVTPEQKAAREAAGGEGGHEHGDGEEGGATIWKIISGVLFAALIATALKGRKGTDKPKPQPRPEAV